MARMFEKWHPSITPERVIDAAERQMTTLDNPGLCLACEIENEDCEPDARGYACEACGEPRVYGAEELMLHISPGNRFETPAIFSEEPDHEP